ncbi:MAG: response regulator transcription factor [Acidobacteriota bacterium]|nr:response regulator transcription factor [Acidobacteriota bacterium]
MIRIIVADDHPVVRRGIGQIVAAAGDMRVADEAATGRELLDRARTVDHDLVLLDLSMPEMIGLDLLKQLKRERPKIPIVILTVSSENQFAIRALKAGAAGYLTKDTAATELVGALRKVVTGGRYLSPSMAERLAGHLTADADRPLHEKLSDREYQVLRMIAAGKSTRRISTELSLSVKTIGTYRARIFEKMQMKSPAELAAYAVRNRLSD